MTQELLQRGRCHAKKGLLFLRDCDAPAVAACAVCGRPICSAHQVPGPKGPQCPECLALEQKTEPGAVTGAGRMNMVDRARYRHHYYDTYGYLPYYYGWSHYYSDRDYRTFDESSSHPEATAAAAAQAESEDVATADLEQLDDFMES
ncbi:MAG: hypothetical protein AB1641_05655 [Thermodesulfobacteriota bacterium]